MMMCDLFSAKKMGDPYIFLIFLRQILGMLQQTVELRIYPNND